MPEYEIRPREGIGSIKLGDSRENLRRELGSPSYSDATKDFFFNASLHAHYSALGTAELLVVASGPFVATFHGVNLLNVDADEALRIVAAVSPVDKGDPEYPMSCTFPSLDLNLWRSCLPHHDPSGGAGRRFESVGVGRQGYFSRHLGS